MSEINEKSNFEYKIIWNKNCLLPDAALNLAINIPSTTHNETPDARESNEGQVYKRIGECILFGSYPQSKVTDTTVLATFGNFDKSWTAYNQHLDGNRKDFMFYKDVTYNGEKYRGVYFTRFTPTIAALCPDYKKFKVNTVYCFKYDPIKWRILKTDDDTFTLVSDLILDCKSFMDMLDEEYNEDSIEEFEDSDIWFWLNDTFYETAFNEIEQDLILDSLGYVSLLSVSDAQNYFVNNTDRKKPGTDYARSQCLPRACDSESPSAWLLQDINEFDFPDACFCVTEDGEIIDSLLMDYSCGVVPTITIKR